MPDIASTIDAYAGQSRYGVSTVLPKPGDRDVDGAGIVLRDDVVAEAHAIHRSRLEVLGDDVELRHEREEELAAFGSFRSMPTLRLLKLLRR